MTMAAENMMNSAHKASNEAYRSNYDRIFGTKKDRKETAKDEKRDSRRV